MFTRKFNQAVTIALLCIGAMSLILGIIYFFIWIANEDNTFDLVTAVSGIFGSAFWLLLAKLSHFLDDKLPLTQKEIDEMEEIEEYENRPYYLK